VVNPDNSDPNFSEACVAVRGSIALRFEAPISAQPHPWASEATETDMPPIVSKAQLNCTRRPDEARTNAEAGVPPKLVDAAASWQVAACIAVHLAYRR